MLGMFAVDRLVSDWRFCGIIFSLRLFTPTIGQRGGWHNMKIELGCIVCMKESIVKPATRFGPI